MEVSGASWLASCAYLVTSWPMKDCLKKDSSSGKTTKVVLWPPEAPVYTHPQVCALANTGTHTHTQQMHNNNKDKA